MNDDKVYFPKGLFFNLPHQNAPDFVKGSIGINVSKFKAYLDKVKGDKLNIDLKVSREGKPYAQINTFKPDKSKSNGNTPQKEDKPAEDGFEGLDDSLPF